MNSLTSQKLKAIFQSKTSTKENPDQYFLECWEFPNGLVMLDDKTSITIINRSPRSSYRSRDSPLILIWYCLP